MKHTLLLCGLLAGFSLAAAPELVMVGDAGNPGKKVYFHEVPNPYPRGGVAYPYRIGRSEVSNAEYAEFLNACAVESDPHRPVRRTHENRAFRRRRRLEVCPRAGPGEGRCELREPGQRGPLLQLADDRRCRAGRLHDSRRSRAKTAGRSRRSSGYRDLTFPDAAPGLCSARHARILQGRLV